MSPVIIKVGGALLENQAIASQLLNEIKQLQTQRPVVLVHGGGPLVETLMAAMGLTSTKIDGLRVTPDEHMPYVCGALAGSANKSLCAIAIGAGVTPVGLSLLDGNLVTCKPLDERFGAVGVPVANDPALLLSLLNSNMLPVISSIGSSDTGRLLNINADQAATVIAQLLGGDLLLLSNVPGVLDGDKALLPSLTQADIQQLSADGIVTDGMLVKVEAALDAANALSKPVTIASWSAPLQAVLSNESGTQIHPVTSGE